MVSSKALNWESECDVADKLVERAWLWVFMI